MANYDNMTLEELLLLKREKEALLQATKSEIRLIARAEEGIARRADLNKKLGDLSPDDLKIIQELAQTMHPDGIESGEQLGDI